MSTTAQQLSEIHIEWEPLPSTLTSVTGFMLYWVTGLAGQFYAKAVATVGLVPQQVATLQLLALEGPMVQARVAERLRINKATMVTILNGLEAQGFVERRSYASDKRALEIHATKAGQSKAKEVQRVNQAADRLFFAALSEKERTTFHALLSKLATSQPVFATKEVRS
jgi:MarR family transcriptional regulator, lower aerobic nicotinate degradation pathway regulator